MFSKFFIERPIFATVLALLIIVAGLVTLRMLPIEQYPNISHIYHLLRMPNMLLTVLLNIHQMYIVDIFLQR